jgi:hypothetical protein
VILFYAILPPPPPKKKEESNSAYILHPILNKAVTEKNVQNRST